MAEITFDARAEQAREAHGLTHQGFFDQAAERFYHAYSLGDPTPGLIAVASGATQAAGHVANASGGARVRQSGDRTFNLNAFNGNKVLSDNVWTAALHVAFGEDVTAFDIARAGAWFTAGVSAALWLFAGGC